MMLALALVLQANTDSLAVHVRQLADSYLTAYFEQHPDEATLDGVANIRHERLPDNSPGALAQRQQRNDDRLPAPTHIHPYRIAPGQAVIAHEIMRDAITR